MMAGQDRISKLPDDVIRYILSFLDMKFVVRTSGLSREWRNIWTTTSQIRLNSFLFGNLTKFAEFTENTLSHRNHSSLVSSLELTIYRGAVSNVLKNIVNYAYNHRASRVTIKLVTKKRSVIYKIPQYFFISRTLKHLSLSCNDEYTSFDIQNSDWDLPSLETLDLTNLEIVNAHGKNVSLFSKCVTLKDLTLSWMYLKGLESFKICAPQLCNLRIKQPHGFPKVLDVASPQLENLTTSVDSSCNDILNLSTVDFNYLQNVKLSMSFIYEEKAHVPGLLRLFKKLRNTKVLFLDTNIVELLSSSMDVCSNEPCPFDDLKSLKIDGVTLEQNDDKVAATMATEVRNYLLKNSPSDGCTMDLPQVPVKRSREPVDNEKKAKKVAKLE